MGLAGRDRGLGVFAVIAGLAWTYAVGARAAWRRPAATEPVVETGPIDQVLGTGAIRTVDRGAGSAPVRRLVGSSPGV